MESLTSLRMAKLRDARDETSHWTSDGRIMVMEEGSSKPKSNIWITLESIILLRIELWKKLFFFCGGGGDYIGGDFTYFRRNYTGTCSRTHR